MYVCMDGCKHIQTCSFINFDRMRHTTLHFLAFLNMTNTKSTTRCHMAVSQIFSQTYNDNNGSDYKHVQPVSAHIKLHEKTRHSIYLGSFTVCQSPVGLQYPVTKEAPSLRNMMYCTVYNTHSLSSNASTTYIFKAIQPR